MTFMDEAAALRFEAWQRQDKGSDKSGCERVGWFPVGGVAVREPQSPAEPATRGVSCPAVGRARPAPRNKRRPAPDAFSPVPLRALGSPAPVPLAAPYAGTESHVRPPVGRVPRWLLMSMATRGKNVSFW